MSTLPFWGAKPQPPKQGAKVAALQPHERFLVAVERRELQVLSKLEFEKTRYLALEAHPVHERHQEQSWVCIFR